MTTVQEYQSKILSFLLSKHDRSLTVRKGVKSNTRPQFTIARSPFYDDYNDEMDYRKKEFFNEALFNLLAEDLIKVQWTKFREGEEAQKVYLNLDRLDEAFRMSRLTPKKEKLEVLRNQIAPLSSHSWEWVRNWFAHAVKHIDQFRIPVGCDIDDPEVNEDLVKILLALPEINDYLPKRIFSQQVLLDSKRFEQIVEKRVLSVYKKFGGVFYDTDEEYLDSLGIVEHAKLSMIAGALQIEIDDSLVDLGHFAGGIGITNESIKFLKVVGIETKRIICVENLTSYYMLVKAVEQRELESTLVIYTGGFPHRSLQKLLGKISDYLLEIPEEIPVYHWGDLDFGGVRIFNFMKNTFFPRLRPYLMDVKIYESLLESGISFGKEYEKKLIDLLESPEYAEWYDLLQLMVKNGKKVEQESIGLWQLI
ncbi:Wadjet anti-phage system protein JetD domain-containing protein [Tumebacillus lipolyticus]|uniref:Wadjet anti-phage system protein JetD domain-containing protein n=1 Tax=Tumebacillus lipolyticus TaxID=1280370 RepID=A0ABW5A2Q3_9BACL